MLNVHNLSIAALAPKEQKRFSVAICGVLVSPPSKADKHGYTCVTDGHLLMKVTRPEITQDGNFPEPQGGIYELRDEKKQFTVPAADAFRCSREIPKSSTIPVLACAAIATVAGERRLVTNDLENIHHYPADMPDSNFPAIEKVLPNKKDYDMAVTVDANLLAALAGQIAKMNKTGRKGSIAPVTIYLKKPKDGRGVMDTILMESRTTDGQEVTSLLMPCRGDADEFMKKRV